MTTPPPICRTCGQPKQRGRTSAGPRWICPTCIAAHEARFAAMRARLETDAPIGYLSYRMTRQERAQQQRTTRKDKQRW